MGGNTNAGMELVALPSGTGSKCPPPHPAGQGWVTSASRAGEKGLLEQRGLGDCVEAMQGLQCSALCPLPDFFSL